jgi:DNA-binding transcriptional regulator YiaG
MALSDDVERITAILVAMHREQGKRQMEIQRFKFGANSIGKIAKLCGASGDLVVAWEDGRVRPTTTQALTWLSVLYSGTDPKLSGDVAEAADR